MGKKETIPFRVQKFLQERQKAREKKNWLASDALRKKIKLLGFEVQDTVEGQKINKDHWGAGTSNKAR
ncbi:MAG: hypothetical protein HY982_01610 [Candidatus Magasanikbacteria bacterium]|nr:hypothetical protein [Candidatus Magasanikbacteria bacterium]